MASYLILKDKGTWEEKDEYNQRGGKKETHPSLPWTEDDRKDIDNHRSWKEVMGGGFLKVDWYACWMKNSRRDEHRGTSVVESYKSYPFGEHTSIFEVECSLTTAVMQGVKLKKQQTIYMCSDSKAVLGPRDAGSEETGWADKALRTLRCSGQRKGRWLDQIAAQLTRLEIRTCTSTFSSLFFGFLSWIHLSTTFFDYSFSSLFIPFLAFF